MTLEARDRCPVCDARDWLDTARAASHGIDRSGHWKECSHCGLLVEDGALFGNGLSSIVEMRMAEERFELKADDPFFLDLFTLRSLALRHRKWMPLLTPAEAAALHEPYLRPAPDLYLEPFEHVRAVPVSLAVLVRASAYEDVLERIAGHKLIFDDIVLVVDGEMPAMQYPLDRGEVRTVWSILDGDFAKQRNIAQVAAHHDWVLQLDDDESLEGATLGDLGRVAAIAERDGALSVGLKRLNHVGGVQSDLFPDIQYRLNRREVRYKGLVHERPDLPRGWRDSFIAPNLSIDHHLDRDRVASRSTLYEALSPGHGRVFERSALNTPYRR